MIYGLIMCAGNQTRFELNIPKALVDINDEKLLDINIKNLNDYCDKVYVVVSNSNKEFFTNYDNTIEISSGLGCGDAVMKALRTLKLKKKDTCYIIWGDSLPTKNIYSSCISSYNGNVIVPCVKENTPYVQIVQKENDKLEIRFSKFNDKIEKGYHDLCVFYGNAKEIYKHCEEFYIKFFVKDKYIHKHNEFSFLDIFNDTDIKGNIVELDNATSHSFNTLDELKDMLRGDL